MRFLPIALALSLVPIPAVAQSQRHPTATEIEGLLQTFRNYIPTLLESGYYGDIRSPEVRQQQDAFVEAWSQVNPAAPFLGNWFAIEEGLEIFPTADPGVVCVIDSNLDISDFYLGRVVDGHLQTDTNLTFVLDSGFLVSTFVYDDRALRYEYANPIPVQDPAASSYFPEYHPNVVEQFQQAGCLVGLPE